MVLASIFGRIGGVETLLLTLCLRIIFLSLIFDAKLATYIHNRNWNFPEAWKDLFPFLEARIVDIVLPLNVRKDQQV